MSGQKHGARLAKQAKSLKSGGICDIQHIVRRRVDARGCCPQIGLATAQIVKT